MPLDPSWLPATAGTISAGFIAIVGGLMASRSVALESEKRATAARVEVLRELTDVAKEEHDVARTALISANADDWLASLADTIVDADQPLSAELLLSQQPSSESAEALTPHLEKAYVTVKKASEELVRLRKVVVWPDTWAGARELLPLPGNGWLDEILVSRVYKRAYQRWALTADQAVPDFTGLPAASPPNNRSPDLRTLGTREYEARRRHQMLESEYKVAVSVLAATTTLPGGKQLVWLLGVFAVAGVGWPILTLAWGADHMSTRQAWLMSSVVVVGVLLVLLALTDKLPRWRWQWVRRRQANHPPG